MWKRRKEWTKACLTEKCESIEYNRAQESCNDEQVIVSPFLHQLNAREQTSCNEQTGQNSEDGRDNQDAHSRVGGMRWSPNDPLE